MKKILLIAIMAIVTTGAFAAKGSKDLSSITKVSKEKKLSKRANDSYRTSLGYNYNPDLITVKLSCCEITYTNAFVIDTYVTLAVLGLQSLVIYALESRWCPPSTQSLAYA